MQRLFELLEMIGIWFVSILRHIVPIPDIKRERIGRQKQSVTSYIFRSDPLVTLLFFVPIVLLVAGAVVFARAVFVGIFSRLTAPSWPSWHTVSLHVFYVVAIYILWRIVGYVNEHFVRRAQPDSLVVRTMFGRRMFFYDCLFFYIPRRTEIVVFPGSQEDVETPDLGQPGVIVSLIRQVAGYGTIGQADNQEFKFTAKVRLNREMPQLLVDAYYADFKEGGDGFSRIRREVISNLRNLSDRILTQFDMRDIETRRTLMEKTAQDILQGVLDELAIDIVILNIPEVGDIGDDGYFSNLRRATRAKLKANADKDSAEAKKDADIAIAGYERDAEVAKANARNTYLLQQEITLKQEEKNLWQAAWNAQQNIIARLKVFAGNEGLAFVHIFEGLSAAEKVSVWEKAMDALRQNLDSATLTNVNVGGEEEAGGFASLFPGHLVANAVIKVMKELFPGKVAQAAAGGTSASV